MNNGYIEGINPSIAKLVYLLNFWGLETYLSHASFYPGDTEEQEYWAQKWGKDEDYNVKLEGPIAVWGGFFNLPYVVVLVPKPEINKLNELLPKFWRLQTPNISLKNTRDFMEAYRLEYQHPDLVKFQKIWDDLCYSLLDKLGFSDRSELFHKGNWKLANEFIGQTLPLSKQKFNDIRDNGINLLEDKLLQTIAKFSPERFKSLVDEYIVKLQIYNHHYNFLGT